MLLAADVGGTKTLLGLFDRAPRRPVPVATRSYPTATFASFGDVLDAFARDVPHDGRIDAAAIGVAGPVLSQAATLTNVRWRLTGGEIAARLGTPRVRLLNDLEAMAYSMDVLTSDELVVLQRGTVDERGNAALIAAGTGLGEAVLHRIGDDLIPMATEGGHADFAARSDREFDFARMLHSVYGRAELEQVLSGPGLLNLHRFTHAGADCPTVREIPMVDRPAAISEVALAGRCPMCSEALDMFVSAYGAESGNLALRGMATAGIFIGGGIAPKVLPALERGVFLRAFLDKAPMSALLAKVRVAVVRIPAAALLGAAVYAQKHLV